MTVRVESTYPTNFSQLLNDESERTNNMKTNYTQQLQVLEEMQSKGFNVCTCGNCGSVILYNQEMRDAEAVECPHCKVEMDYSDNPDYYYDNCPEVHQEQ